MSAGYVYTLLKVSVIYIKWLYVFDGTRQLIKLL